MLESETLTSFFSGLDATLTTAAQVRRQYDLDFAMEFNPLLSFYHMGENRLSDILAYFLNPQERHGQGIFFLKSFLDHTKLNRQVGTFSEVEIIREKQTDSGRFLDIYISFDSGQFVIGIENKLWAGDQRNQLRDYSQFLSSISQKHCLIYLTPNNHAPGAHSISKAEAELLTQRGIFQAIDYSSDISNLLLQWIANCRAEKVRAFLKDLHQFLQHEVNGASFFMDHKTISDFVLNTSSTERLECAIKVHEAANGIYDDLTGNMKAELEKMAFELGITLTDVKLDRYESSHFNFLLPENTASELYIRFEWEKKYFKNGYYGLVANDQASVGRLTKTLALSLGKAYSSDSWPWYIDFAPYTNFSNYTYLDFKNGKFIGAVREKVSFLLKKLREIA